MNPLAPSGGSSQPTEEVAETATNIEVEPIEPQLKRAGERLSENYEGFLEREPLGFGPGVWDDLTEDLQDRIVDFDTLRESVEEGRWQGALRSTLPVWMMIAFILVMATLDRAAMRVARRWQGRIHIGSNVFLTESVRVVIFIAGRSTSVGVLLLLSYFPIQAVFDQAPWSLVGTRLLWLALVYRAAEALIVAVYGLGLVNVTDAHAARIKSFLLWAIRLIFAWLGALYTIEILDWHPEVQAFGRVAFRATLTVIPLYLYASRSAVADLFPDPKDSAVFAAFRKFLLKNYFPLLTITIVLLGLRTAGFVRASNFILSRGYAIVFFSLFALVGATRLHGWLTRRREGVDSREQGDLFRSLTYLLRIAGSIIFAWAVLKLLLLWEPLVTVLKIPLVSIAGNGISPAKVITALLILGGAALFGRLLKAILLTKVYPALNVDVGVGYAVNTLINYALIVIGFFIALAALGVNLSAMTVVLASLGVGIGFGLQTLTENLISGFILLFGRSVKKGDIITAGDLYGRVEEVGARSVLVKTPDNYDLLIPSKEIVGARIVNWSYHDSLVRLHVPVGVTYRADPRKVESILKEAALEHEFVLPDPKPEVWLVEFGNSSVNFDLLVYFNCREITQERLKGQLNFIIWDKLAENDIEIPFPQRDLHIRSGGFAEPVADAIIERLRGQKSSGEAASNDEDGDDGDDGDDREDGADESKTSDAPEAPEAPNAPEGAGRDGDVDTDDA